MSSLLLERGLPSNVDAERLLLGSLVYRGERFAQFADALRPADFSLDKHALIWQRLSDLHEAGKRIDRITLAEELNRRGELQRVDGLTYLAELDEGLPEIFDLDGYFRIVREKATARRVILHCSHLVEKVLAGDEDLADLIERADLGLSELTGALVREREFHSAEDVFSAAGGIDAYLSRRRLPGVPFPWSRLTRWTGGLQGGDLCIIAADTGRGKTTFALNCAIHAARHTGLAVPIISLEMSREQLTDKMVAALGKFDGYELRREPDLSLRRKILSAATEATELPILFRDRSTNIAALPSMLRRLRSKRPVGLVIVDYLQLIEADGRTRADQVARVARGLKNAAMDLGLPIVALSQFRRPESRMGGGRQLADLKESSEIEQAANLVLFLETKQDDEKQFDPAAPVPVEVVVAKQRLGAANLSVSLTWRRDWGVFYQSEEGETRS